MTPAETLAAAFVAECESTFTRSQMMVIRKRNASPEYAGDVCATHDFADANMIMLGAWESTFGAPPRFLSDPESDAGQTDMRLWGAAWTLAKDGALSSDQGA